MHSYIPAELPLNDILYDDIRLLIGRANRALGTYNGLIQTITNADLLLAPLMLDEAVASLRIEGTQATLTEVMEYHAGMKKSERLVADIAEINSYRDALKAGSTELALRPLSLHFVKSLHQILMSNVRGRDKNPGEFRKIQNWIGRPGSSIEEATFVPPAPENLQSYLDNWAAYIAVDDEEILIQIAIVHAQFELIHPFMDGNGRIGRLLIPLFLYYKKAIEMPGFYLSGYFEKNRDAYYRALSDISEKKAWKEWIKFFLNAVIVQSNYQAERVKAILRLYDEMKVKIQSATRSQFSVFVLDVLFNKPIFHSSSFTEELGAYEVNENSAKKLLSQLKKVGLLEETEPRQGRKPATLRFKSLTDLLK